MRKLEYPLSFEFKIVSFGNQIYIKNCYGEVIGFVKQKLLKLTEAVKIYTDENSDQLSYAINADRWLDFSARYTFTDAQGAVIGSVKRDGVRSLWKAKYTIFDENEQTDLIIQEENAWVKVLDGLVGQIPILNLFTGYFLNPTYIVGRNDGTEVARFKKEPSFIGRKFKIEQTSSFETGEETRIYLSLIMFVLLERQRG
jgi:uncharacterized protein YxjI